MWSPTKENITTVHIIGKYEWEKKNIKENEEKFTYSPCLLHIINYLTD